MEDQQPGSGDLTDATPAVESEVVESDVVTGDEVVIDDELVSEEVTEETDLVTPAKQPSAARKWLAENRTKALIGTAAGSFVVASAFAAGAAQPYLMDRATVATKMTVARTAVDAINTLWTYTPADMDKLPDRASKFLSGDFKDQYRKFVDAIAATNKQAEVTNSTQVVAAAVESLQGNEATALVYTNTTSTSPKAKIPTIKYLSYKLDMKRQGTEWKVTKMNTVTSFDLTPKL